MGIIAIILGLVAFIVVALFIKAFISELFRQFPALVWILAVIVGLAVGFSTKWWGGLIVGLIALGWFYSLQEDGGDKCVHCGSFDTQIIHYEGSSKAWKCNKCGNITYTKDN